MKPCHIHHNQPGIDGQYNFLWDAHHLQGAFVQQENIIDTEHDETLELIEFQHGAVCEAGVNGVTNEALLAIVAHRLQGFQDGPMACPENREALLYVLGAICQLHNRTRRRLAAGVEGRGKP